MAIYHLNAKTGSKASGQSAAAKYAYVCREDRYRWDRDELLFAESGNMPAWAERAPATYWQAADVYERANGRLFKQVEFALPVELKRSQAVELARQFARELTGDVDGGRLPYTLAVHAGDGKNPHAHLVISERLNDGRDRSPETWFRRAAVKGHDPESGGARKTEALKPQEWLENVREGWARSANRALQELGRQERVDHRSLEAQGAIRIPQIHVGPQASSVPAADRMATHAEIVAANRELVRLEGERLKLAQEARLLQAQPQRQALRPPATPARPAASAEPPQPRDPRLYAMEWAFRGRGIEAGRELVRQWEASARSQPREARAMWEADIWKNRDASELKQTRQRIEWAEAACQKAAEKVQAWCEAHPIRARLLNWHVPAELRGLQQAYAEGGENAAHWRRELAKLEQAWETTHRPVYEARSQQERQEIEQSRKHLQAFQELRPQVERLWADNDRKQRQEADQRRDRAAPPRSGHTDRDDWER